MSVNFRNRKTPGVYVTELPAFPRVIVGVETAVPAFIGYTQTAERNGENVSGKPIKIESLAEYQEIFGEGCKPVLTLALVNDPITEAWDFKVYNSAAQKSDYFSLTLPESNFYLYNSLRLFYENGGGNCYILSVGLSDCSTTVKIKEAELAAGLTTIGDESGPTILLMPDAVLLEDKDEYYGLMKKMLDQCKDEQDRVALIDVYGGYAIKDSTDIKVN